MLPGKLLSTMLQELAQMDLGNPMARMAPILSAATGRIQLGCAIFVLGNLIGTTLTHEVGHSLGLANPYGQGYHNPGDRPNRLMDAGGDRPFEERAQLSEQGPAVFCDQEYDYLRTILTGAPDGPPAIVRPPCD